MRLQTLVKKGEIQRSGVAARSMTMTGVVPVHGDDLAFTPPCPPPKRKLCPSLITVSGDFEKYEKFSRLMFSYAYDHTPVVEVASIDKDYFDLKGNFKRSFGPRSVRA
jgi:impB/mucB/samB family protein